LYGAPRRFQRAFHPKRQRKSPAAQTRRAVNFRAFPVPEKGIETRQGLRAVFRAHQGFAVKPGFLSRRRLHMTTQQIIWREVDHTWHLLLGNESVAQIIPNAHEGTPCWLTTIWELPCYGWHAVDFLTLEDAKAALTRWCQAVFNFGDPAEIAEFWAHARENYPLTAYDR
jgi:hypothetical protein